MRIYAVSVCALLRQPWNHLVTGQGAPLTRVTPRRADELIRLATSTVQEDQARVLDFQLLAAPFTHGLLSLTATSFPLACARKHRL